MSCTLRDIQNKQHEMLKELARVCEKRNIKYYLAQGTLLGAVRHKGFIPWDDDIDVIVPYDELERLMRIFPCEGDQEYMITNHTVEKHYPLTWTKIRAKNTLSRPKRYKDVPVNWGICIDLFPAYPVSDNALFRTCEILFFRIARKMLIAEMTKYEEGHHAVTRIMESIPISVRHFFLNLSLKLFTSHKDDTKYVYLLCKNGKVMKREWIFGEKTTLSFEGEDYPVPTDYHKFLTEMYGDYMSLPPIEEQGGHDLHLGEIEWDC